MATEKRILLIDPVFYMREFVHAALEYAGYEVTSVHTIREGCDVLARAGADLIITEAFDQPSPLTFEPRFLEKLRPYTKGTPILVASTYIEKSHSRAKSYGVDDVMAKPFDIDDLLTTVNSLIGAKYRPNSDPVGQ